MMEPPVTPLSRLLDQWSQLDQVTHQALVGLDGYVDFIQRPVRSQSAQGPNYYPNIADFGQKILAASGKSAQIELYTQEVKLGGNAPIMANALASLGITNTCLGTFGYPEPLPIFQQIHPDCHLVSVGEAAQTNALEFNDGKLMLSEVSTFSEVDWKTVRSRVDFRELGKRMEPVSLVALVDWCNLPHGNGLWQGILTDLVRPLERRDFQFFFDLADPSQKGETEVRQVLDTMRDFGEYGEVTLGLNENEARKLWVLLNGTGESESLEEVGQFIFDRLELDRVVIHPLDRALVFERGGGRTLPGRVVQKPRVTTGGGDNFNAGFMFGVLQGFDMAQCLVLGMAASGSYVENGRSPNQQGLYDYMENWYRELKKTTA